jgi:hypothetical protein
MPNVAKAAEKGFITIGLKQPIDLVDKDPYQMYQELCNITQQRRDPCAIDVFISAVEYMKGGKARKWWGFAQQRKEKLAGK